MKTDTVPPLTINTWLPVFSGFYGTIWETDYDEENEIEYINELRAAKNLPAVTWDDIEWNYAEYRNDVSKGITRRIEKDLKSLGLVSGITFQEVRSPHEYNFTNDSINVEILITRANTKKILFYLREHIEKFSEYIKEKYTTRSGFISSYSNDVETWLDGETTGHGHKLGSVLQFILLNENGEDYEQRIYEDLHGNGVTLQAQNYDELTGGNLMDSNTKKYRIAELKAVEVNPAPYKRTLQIYGGNEASITKHLAITEEEFQKIKAILTGEKSNG